VFVHDSTGSIVAYLDGDEALSVTGADTRQQTGDDITLVHLFGAAATRASALLSVLGAVDRVGATSLPPGTI
jgi:hypothetical protein